jgi:hypothetical protein
VGVEYAGMPYEWGGWDTVGCFLDYVNQNKKRAGSHDENDCQSWGDPSWATGIDCSGLVSRAWDLPGRLGTGRLNEVSTEIQGGYEYLLRGDILLKPGSHTFIFESWAPDSDGIINRMVVIEAADFRGDPPFYTSEARKNNYRWTIARCIMENYKPYRYNNVQELPWYDPDRTGDVNGDGNVSVPDVVCLVNYLFKGGVKPKPYWRGDANGNCKVSVSDIVYIINYLFKGGYPPSYCNGSCWDCKDYPVR